MRKGDDIPTVEHTDTTKKAILEISAKGIGCTLVENNNKLVGVFTDGDLRRIFEKDAFNSKVSISSIMTNKPKSISIDYLAVTALEIMEDFKITTLAVTDSDNRIIGIVNMHDLIKLGLK